MSLFSIGVTADGNEQIGLQRAYQVDHQLLRQSGSLAFYNTQ